MLFYQNAENTRTSALVLWVVSCHLKHKTRLCGLCGVVALISWNKCLNIDYSRSAAAPLWNHYRSQ